MTRKKFDSLCEEIVEVNLDNGNKGTCMRYAAEFCSECGRNLCETHLKTHTHKEAE